MRGVESLLNQVKKDGLPEAFSKRTQYRARKDRCGTNNHYGALVSTIAVTSTKGEPLEVPFQNPFAMLYQACIESEAFSAIIAGLFEKLGGNKANLIFYTDGISPADGLKKHDNRKLVAIYWSILEFGPVILAHEEVWCVASVLQVKTTQRLAGGLSHAIKAILKNVFFYRVEPQL